MSRNIGEQVLARLLAGDDPVLATLREQSLVASVARRERTEVGFFELFRVPPSAPCLDGCPDFVLDDVAAELEGLGGSARFLLSVRDGVLDFLEGSMLGFRWPDDARLRRVYYLRGLPGANVVVESATRDLDELRRRWTD